MNTTRSPKTFSAVSLAVAAFATAVTAGPVGAPAAPASEPRDQVTSSSATARGAYATALDALVGETLSQYLADHWAPVVAADV